MWTNSLLWSLVLQQVAAVFMAVSSVEGLAMQTTTEELEIRRNSISLSLSLSHLHNMRAGNPA